MSTPTTTTTTAGDMDVDPNPRGADRFIGREMLFDMEGRRRLGVVKAARYVGRTARGAIPDYSLELQGQSGRRVTVSLVESHAQFPG